VKAPRKKSTVSQTEVTRAQSKIERRIEYVAVDALCPSPHNVRTHSRKQISQIARSIKRFGFQPPIIINGGDRILAGHGRKLAAEELGLAEVPCVRVTELSQSEERAFALAENRIAENAGTDRELLAAELLELSVLLPELSVPDDIELTGFSFAEFDVLQHDFAEATKTDDNDEPFPEGGPPVSLQGDLWLLGKHRIVCGDARDPDAYGRLFDGAAAAEMVITDPPYNVRIRGHVAGRGKVKHQEFAFASGEMKDDEFRQFLLESIGGMAAACRPGALIYTFVDWRSVELFCRVGRELGLTLVNICVWNKTTPGQGSFYRSAHELICVLAKPGGSRRNNIELGRHGRSRTNVWTFAAPNKFATGDDAIRQHPTPKPVNMIAEAIKDASGRGAVVLDAFLGSGTTILAAEKVGRVGYAIEYEPVYVDLAIRRWQRVTGRDAILAGTDQTFNEIAENGRASPIPRQPLGRPHHSRRRS
jgi:DNA modification methylase